MLMAESIRNEAVVWWGSGAGHIFEQRAMLRAEYDFGVKWLNLHNDIHGLARESNAFSILNFGYSRNPLSTLACCMCARFSVKVNRSKK